jgi:hypothetical protein
VSSLQPRPGHWLLRCPLCKFELTAAAGALVCRNGHSFDLAREGYVNLLHSGRRRPAAGGDSAAQLRHRTAFLDAGHLDGVATAIVEHLMRPNTQRPLGPWRILDAGSGTGHHLTRVAATLARPVIGLGLDISKEAARQAARRWPASGSPCQICGPNGRCTTRQSISSSASSRQKISPRQRAFSVPEGGSHSPIPDRII